MKERKEVIRELSENYKSVTGNYNTFSLKKNKDLLEEIAYHTSFLDEDAKLKERLYLIENELDEKPKCICCKKPDVTLVNTKKGYCLYCGQDCFTKINNMKFLERMEFFKDDFSNIDPCGLDFFKKIVDEQFTSEKGLNKVLVKELGIPLTFKEISKLIYVKTKDFLPIDTSTSTLLYYTYSEAKEKPTCKVCGSDNISLISFEKGFEKYCSTTCSNRYNKDLVKEKMLEQHGVDNYFASKEFAETRELIYLATIGAVNPSKLDKVKKKKEETYLKKSNGKHSHNSQFDDVKEHKKKHFLKKYGVTCPLAETNIRETYEDKREAETGYRNPNQNPEIKKRIVSTNVERYGVSSYLCKEEVREKGKQVHKERTGFMSHFQTPEGKKNAKKYQEKAKKTYKEKTGYSSPFHNPSVIEKIEETKRKNKTHNSSRLEKDIYKKLKKVYSDIESQKKLGPGRLNTDYYIPSLNLFIELQGYPTHNFKAFDKDNKEHQLELKEMFEKIEEKKCEGKCTKWYENQIKVWTTNDVSKRYYAKDNNINYLEIYVYDSIEEIINQIERVTKGIYIKSSDDILQKEMDYFNNTKGKLETRNNRNKIIFQFTPQFFEVENNLYKKDPIIRRKLIENRIKYLNKKEQDLSDLELLTGFKKSGLHYGFSHFSPLWIKYFIERYSVSSIYDPCGGWGHRLVGTGKTGYIYNDIDERNVESVKSISDYFSMENKTFYNRDSSDFIPIEDYDAVFTCPPYYDLEDYTHSQTSHKKYPDYSDWLEYWWSKTVDNFLSKKPNYVGIVLKENLVKAMIGLIEQKGYSVVEKSVVGLSKNGYLSKQNVKNKEFLIVLKREN